MLTFQSVILTSVYDARNIRRKVRLVAYAADDAAVRNARIFGLVKVEGGNVQIANRIFETRLYNYFLTLPEAQEDDLYQLASLNKNRFIRKGQLDMAHILEKVV